MQRMNGREGRDCSSAAIYIEVDPFFHPLQSALKRKTEACGRDSRTSHGMHFSYKA